MTISGSSAALRSPLQGLRHKPTSFLRPRVAGPSGAAALASHGMTADSVFKRLPAIGDTPVRDKQAF
ncbi:hypothetical protein QTH91_01725 [Variovorax dokdonensis]|uniref:Uncharacterized protein n=1 Tax=Variovorax dokdonensis TaxID=344883 RepID=A0ABT7N5P1_9BURK|nr:hypothetical protein [Variovorax dokdonensis]MDM0043190.1 hypothetical protein [Variovorax dokdonensis]